MLSPLRFTCVAMLAAFVFSASALLSQAAAAGDPPTVDELLSALDQRDLQLKNLEFTYEVSSNLLDDFVLGTSRENDLTLRKTTEVYKTLASDDKARPLDWVSWTVLSPSPGRTDVAFFFVYDGKQHYRFHRAGPEKKSASPNQGHVDAGYKTDFLLKNYFERVVFMQPAGSSRNLDAIKSSRHLAKRYKVLRKTECLGHPGWVLEGDWVPGKLKVRTVVITEPAAMVVSHSTVSIPGDKVQAEFSVEKLGTLDGLLYPEKGRYRETEEGREYAFNVLSAKRLSEEARGSWIPAWPGGTRVCDNVSNRVLEVKLTAEEQARAMEAVSERSESVLKIGLVLLGIALLSGTVTLLFLRRGKRCDSGTATEN